MQLIDKYLYLHTYLTKTVKILYSLVGKLTEQHVE